jgi:hypothetical protein
MSNSETVWEIQYMKSMSKMHVCSGLTDGVATTTYTRTDQVSATSNESRYSSDYESRHGNPPNELELLMHEWAIIDLILRPRGVLKHVRCVATYLLVAGQYPKRRNIFDSPWRYLCFRKKWHRAWFILWKRHTTLAKGRSVRL